MMRWISVRREVGECRSRRTLQAFALRMTLRASASAFIISALLLPLLHGVGFLSASPAEILLFCLLIAAISGVACWWMARRAGLTILRLTRSSARFERLSRIDALSGLLNRRAFAEALSAAKPGTSLVIVDVDRFKSINDGYGHASGDDVIRRVSALIVDVVGRGCPVGRLGGEEFGFLLDDGTIEARIELVESLRLKIASEAFGPGNCQFQVTISAGMAETDTDRSVEFVYAAADKALYLAKAGGRNRFVHDASGLTMILDLVNAERNALEESGQISKGVA